MTPDTFPGTLHIVYRDKIPFCIRHGVAADTEIVYYLGDHRSSHPACTDCYLEDLVLMKPSYARGPEDDLDYVNALMGVI